jgi:hypothetical protein
VLVVESIKDIAVVPDPSVAQDCEFPLSPTFLTRDIPPRAPPFLLV